MGTPLFKLTRDCLPGVTRALAEPGLVRLYSGLTGLGAANNFLSDA